MTELAHRANDGVEVTLFWNESDGRLTVVVFDTRSGDAFALDAPSDNALDVFYHPYFYAEESRHVCIAHARTPF